MRRPGRPRAGSPSIDTAPGSGRALVAGQIALSIVRIVSAALLVRSFRNLSDVDLGFDPHGVIVTSFYDLGSFAAPDRRAAFREEVTAAIQSLPGSGCRPYLSSALM